MLIRNNAVGWTGAASLQKYSTGAHTLDTSSAAQQAARLDCSVVSHNIKIEKKVKLVSLKLCVWKSRVHESYIKSWRHVEVFMEKPQLVSILQFLES